MSVLPACACNVQRFLKEGSDALDLESQRVVSYSVGPSQEQAVLLTSESHGASHVFSI